MRNVDIYPKATNLENYFKQRAFPAPPANKAEALAKLFAPYKNCKNCPLGNLGRTQVVFGDGNPNASLMFVGEGPGRDEDKNGKPFVGRAGKLLTKIIEAMDMKREDVYISNVVKCRPPGNRTPLPEESKACTPILLFKEIEIVGPDIICTLGACATQLLINQTTRISHARGQFYAFASSLLAPTYHPAYLLRNPGAKRAVWEDMKKIKNKLFAKN
jgi:DNA polymerase